MFHGKPDLAATIKCNVLIIYCIKIQMLKINNTTLKPKSRNKITKGKCSTIILNFDLNVAFTAHKKMFTSPK